MTAPKLKRIQILNRMNQIVKYIKEKKREKIFRVAMTFGYTPRYFRYSILPWLQDLSEGCVQVEGREVVWACEEEGGG